MQWHPIFAHLLRPMLESYYEVRTDQSVGDLPRRSDVVLLRKASAGAAPFTGLWSRLTAWNVLEYKGPTVSARLDELHDLVELGLGIHRRLNEQQAKANLPELDYPEVSFWYLVNHLGRRFLGALPAHLPGARQLSAGLWQAPLFRHPLFLVSVRELEVERDSLALHVLAGVPDADQGAVAKALAAEPALLPSFGAWLSIHQPPLWKEILHVTAQRQGPVILDFGPLVEYLTETGGVKGFLETVGIRQVVEAVGLEELCAELSPEQREVLLQHLAQRSNPPQPGGPTE